MRMSFRYRFEAAHRLTSAASPACQTPHGHSWHATLHFKSSVEHLDGQNMLAEFQQVKGQWKNFIRETVDHSFFYNVEDSIAPALKEAIPNMRGLPTPGDPTTEIIAVLFLRKAEILAKQKGLTAVTPCSIDIQETEVNALSVSVDSDLYKNVLERLPKTGWWESSNINDRSF